MISNPFCTVVRKLAAGDLIGHIYVVRPHARLQQLVHQLHHHLGIVVHAAQQHGLTAQRDPGLRQPARRVY
jgi:hypothetical protein